MPILCTAPPPGQAALAQILGRRRGAAGGGSVDAKFFWPVRSVAGVEGWDGRRPETALGAFTKFESLRHPDR